MGAEGFMQQHIISSEEPLQLWVPVGILDEAFKSDFADRIGKIRREIEDIFEIIPEEDSAMVILKLEDLDSAGP